VSFVRRCVSNFLSIATYSVIGMLNTLIDFSLFSLLCLKYSFPAWEANVASYSTAVVFSFFTNRRFTFRSGSASYVRTIDQFGRFLIVSLMGLLASSVTTYLLSPSVGPILAKAVAIPVTLCLGFTITRVWVFPMSATASPSPVRDDPGLCK
jgi:putative flippase GtrA